MNLSNVVQKLETDTLITVFVNGARFTGTVAESEIYETTLSLLTDTGVTLIDLSAIVAVQLPKAMD